MPRKYTRKNEKVDVENLQKAMNSVLTLGMSQKKASAEHKVSRATLQRALTRGHICEI